MPSTYSDLKLQLMATGENNTTWGIITNDNLEALESAISQSTDVSFSGSDIALTLINSNAPQPARSMRLVLSGISGGPRNLTVPNVAKLYAVHNTLADAVTVKTAASAGIVVPAGRTMLLVCDGVNVGEVINHAGSMTLGTPLPVTSGGTGSSSQGDALINIGGAARGANDDITSLRALTSVGPLTGPYFLELAGERTDSNVTGIDFHTVTGVDYNARIWRGAGVDAPLSTAQNGNGNIDYWINGVERFRIQYDGNISIPNGSLFTQGINATGVLEIRNVSPTINLRDTDGPTAFMHCNGGTFYILRGAADSTTWTQVGSAWPLQINLNNNDATFGANVTAARFYGPLSGNADSASNASHAWSVGGGNLDANLTWTAGNIYLNAGSGAHHIVVRSGAPFNIHDETAGSNFMECTAGQGTRIGMAGNRGLTVYGDCYATGNLGGFSDRRLKDDLQQITSALDKVEALTGYTFQRTDLDIRQTGLIAQDVDKVLPEAVLEGPDGMLALNYGSMMGLIVEAIKELRAKVEALS